MRIDEITRRDLLKGISAAGALAATGASADALTHTTTEPSPMDDKDPQKVAYIYSTDGKAILIFHYEVNSITLQLRNSNDILNIESGRTPYRYRINKDPASRFALADRGRHGQTLSFYNGTLIKKLFENGGILLIEVDLYQAGRTIFKFDIDADKITKNWTSRFELSKSDNKTLEKVMSIVQNKYPEVNNFSYSRDENKELRLYITKDDISWYQKNLVPEIRKKIPDAIKKIRLHSVVKPQPYGSKDEKREKTQTDTKVRYIISLNPAMSGGQKGYIQKNGFDPKTLKVNLMGLTEFEPNAHIFTDPDLVRKVAGANTGFSMKHMTKFQPQVKELK